MFQFDHKQHASDVAEPCSSVWHFYSEIEKGSHRERSLILQVRITRALLLWIYHRSQQCLLWNYPMLDEVPFLVALLT